MTVSFLLGQRCGLIAVVGAFTWSGQPSGRVNIGHRGELADAANVTLVTPWSLNDTTTSGVSLESGVLGVLPTYNGRSMTSYQIIRSVMEIMAGCAARGLESGCTALNRPDLVITPVLDTRGQPLLKCRQMIKAMRIVFTWMVGNDRIGEVDVGIQKNRNKIGQVRLRYSGPTESIAIT